MRILQIILSIIFPPLGVFMTAGLSTALIINILLTLLGWVPGVIHALWLISRQAERANSY